MYKTVPDCAFNVCFIVAGMDKRVAFLNKCIQHYKNSRYAGCDIYCYFQGDNWSDVQGRDVFKDVVIDRNPRGVFTPRYELMKRFACAYDYCIIIDDDLYIQPETDYFATIKFMEKYPNVGCACITHIKRAVKNEIRIVNNGQDYFNIAGGLVLSRCAVETILDYFKDKERDYTFDCFWLLLWVKGYDLAKDFRSWSKHVAAQRVNGEWSGFNESRSAMEYIPIMPEYITNVESEFNHGQHEVKIPEIKNINYAGLCERIYRRKEMQL